MRATFLIVFLLFVGASVAQTRDDSFDAAAVAITAIQLEPQADGGCAARWCGEIVSVDGGATARGCTDVVQLKATVNQNRCTGLANGGVNRVLRELRFDVDGGAP